MENDSGLTDGGVGFLVCCVVILAIALAMSLDKLDNLQSQNIKLEARLETLLLQLSRD